jgi:hypothetical protein
MLSLFVTQQHTSRIFADTCFVPKTSVPHWARPGPDDLLEHVTRLVEVVAQRRNKLASRACTRKMRHVGFTAKSGHRRVNTACPFCATRRHRTCLFDHVIGLARSEGEIVTLFQKRMSFNVARDGWVSDAWEVRLTVAPTGFTACTDLACPGLKPRL